MKTYECLRIGLVLALSFLVGCKDEPTGTLIFQGVDNSSDPKSTTANLQFSPANQTKGSFVMHTKDLKFSVAEIWVAQELVKEGVADNFKWHLIGESSGLKSASEYKFTVNNLPVGDYQSVKINFRNHISRTTVYQSDLSKTVEMKSSLNESDCGDETILPNYFSKEGNHYVSDGIFKRASKGERIRGFKIKEDETTSILWGIGSPEMTVTDCWFTWNDLNNNNQWDCGIDSLSDFDCSLSGPMFYFSVDDGEEDPGWEDDEEEQEEQEEPRINVDTNYMVFDIVRNKYKAVKIGDQVWMAENLRTNRLNDSTLIINNPESSAWEWAGGVGNIPTQCVYNNDIEFLRSYGRFYNWQTVSTGKICPKGWHVPTKDEWQKLIDYVGEANTLKIAKSNFWNGMGNNESKFSAQPAGYRNQQGKFYYILDAGYWWTSTTRSDKQAYYFYLPGGVTYHIPFDQTEGGYFGCGKSIRCIKD
jgi:uncharacterized protein (TIGR02145 family)